MVEKLTSPFGKYAQVTAVVAAMLIMVAHIGFLALTFLTDGVARSPLGDWFGVAIGTLFGSFATVNGVKPQVDALNRRLDAAGIPTASKVDGGIS